MAKKQTTPATPATPSPADELQRLGTDYWDFRMRTSPTWATQLGDHRFDDRLPEIDAAARGRAEGELRDFRGRLSRIAVDRLGERDRVSADVLAVALDLALEEPTHRLWQWDVDQIYGPQVWLFLLPTYHPRTAPKHFADYAARCEAFGGLIDAQIANLREGLREGRPPFRGAVERVVAQCKAHLAAGPAASPLAEMAKAIPATVPAAERDRLARRIGDAIGKVVLPALARYQQCLEAEVLPRARTQPPGIRDLPGAAAAYAWAIRSHTRAGLDADRLHRLGLDEVARIRAEMEKIAAGRGHRGPLEGFFATLRADKAQWFASREELMDAAKRLLAQATAQLPALFGRLPKTPCEVWAIEAHREKDSVAAFYHGPAEDGSRPGVYYVNTHAPETRPRYNLPALTLHEAVPGHHLQIALALEATDLPPFRRHGHFTAYVEGWALYSERLGIEMGCYPDDLSRFGMLTYEAWRACRLVVDTGLHHLGWTRDQALDYMRNNLALTDTEIVNEVDRYIIWPGQALAYKVGQLEILALRDEAKAALGARFDLRAFHDTILAPGAVPLEVLRRIVERWVAGFRGRA